MKKLLLITGIVCMFSAFYPKKISWVAIGDSITYLNEHASETGSRVTKGYMTRVIEKMPNVQYTNQGHNGWTAGNIADEIDKLGLTKADVYSIFLGTNDWWQGRPIGTMADYLNNSGNNTFFGSYRIIIDKIKNLNSAAKIILIAPMQRVDFVYLGDMKNNAYGSYKEKNGQMLVQFVSAIDSIAAHEHLPMADLYHDSGMTLETLVKFKRLKDPQTGVYKNYVYPAYINVPFNPEKDEYPYPAEAVDMTYDGLHPSDKGFSIIADMLVKVMKKIL